MPRKDAAGGSTAEGGDTGAGSGGGKGKGKGPPADAAPVELNDGMAGGALRSPGRSRIGSKGRRGSVQYVVFEGDFDDDSGAGSAVDARGRGGAGGGDLGSLSPLRVDDGDVDAATEAVAALASAEDDAALIEEYFRKLTYYIASEPEGELSAEQADEMLGHLCELYMEEEHRAYLDIYAADAVFTAMHRAAGRAETQVLACCAIRNLIGTEHGLNLLLAKGVTTELVECYQHHRDPAEFAELHAMMLSVMCELACEAGGQASMNASGVAEVFAGVLKGAPRRDVNTAKWACAAVGFWVEHNEDGQQAALSAGVLPLLIERIKAVGGQPADSGVCALACSALKNLLELPEARAALLDTANHKTGLLPDGGAKVLVDCLRAHAGVPEVLAPGVAAVVALTQGSASIALADELACLRGSGAREAMEEVAAAHARSPQLAGDAERALAGLSEGVAGYAWHSVLAGLASLWWWGGADTSATDSSGSGGAGDDDGDEGGSASKLPKERSSYPRQA